MRTERLEKGEIAEQKVKSRLVELGFPVSTPEVTCAYDTIVDLHGELVRLQIKSGHIKEDGGRRTFEVGFRKTGYLFGEKCKTDSYEEDEVDAFAVYNHVEDECYWLWFDESPSSTTDRVISGWREELLSEKLK